MLQHTCTLFVQPKNQHKHKQYPAKNSKKGIRIEFCWPTLVKFRALYRAHAASATWVRVSVFSFFFSLPSSSSFKIHFECGKGDFETETETEIEQILSPNQNLKYATWAMEMVMETKVPSHELKRNGNNWNGHKGFSIRGEG